MNTTSSEGPTVTVQPGSARLADWLANYPSDVFDERLYQSIEIMERYSIELSIDVLGQLGVLDELTDWKSARALCDGLSFQARFCSALEWLLERLVETEVIEARMEDGVRVFRLAQKPWIPEIQRVRALGLQINSGNAATFDLLDHAAGLYPAVARGQQTGDQSLFDPKGIALWLSYFHNDNPTYAVNNWVGAIQAADRLSSAPSIRILEIGAGAGSGTETLLRWFETRGLLSRIERYLVTEPNAFFRRRAQKNLTNRYSNVAFEWSTLDLNQPWHDQIAGSASFDLIYAVNVLHISKDLLFSLTEAASLLSERGWLVIGECVRPYPNQPIYPELMFQNLESFTDVRIDPEIRPRAGFLTPEQWRRAFDRAGLVRTDIAPALESIRNDYRHFYSGAICGQKNGNHNDAASG